MADLENQNLVYCREGININPPVAPYRTTIKLPRENAEPIYENIPLPWREGDELRSRASSIQSAPEVVSNKVKMENVEMRQKNNINAGKPPQHTAPNSNQPVTIQLNASSNSNTVSDVSTTDTSAYSAGKFFNFLVTHVSCF